VVVVGADDDPLLRRSAGEPGDDVPDVGTLRRPAEVEEARRLSGDRAEAEGVERPVDVRGGADPVVPRAAAVEVGAGEELDVRADGVDARPRVVPPRERRREEEERDRCAEGPQA
jgi:hypothetical protein